MKERQNDICYMCGGPATTRDHIPPKAIFPDPKPGDLITVPACRECNERASLDDEYFRILLATANSQTPSAKNVINRQIIMRARKKPALFLRLMREATKVDVYSEGGIFVKQWPAFKYDRTRVQKTVDKIVRGLFWQEQAYILGDTYEVGNFVLYLPSPNKNPPIPDEGLQRAVLSLPRKQVGDGRVFTYRCLIDSQYRGVTGWFLEFYETTLIMTMTGAKDDTLQDQSHEFP